MIYVGGTMAVQQSPKLPKVGSIPTRRARRYSVTVSTSPSHGLSRGSNPLSDAISALRFPLQACIIIA